MNVCVRIGVLGVLGLGTLLGGCRSGSGSSGGSESARKFDDPIARTELRERAIELLADSANGERAELRANAVEGLSLAPARFVPVARSALLDENAGVRAVAAFAAGRAGTRELMPAVEPLIHDSSAYAQTSAIFAMRRFGAPTDPTPIARMLLNDPLPSARAHAAMLLGELGDPSASNMLREAAGARMSRADPAEVRLMRLQIAEALVKLGHEDHLQPIRAALYPSTSEDFEATALAVQILGELRDRASAPQLVYLESEWETEGGGRLPPEIRLGIATALGKMGRTEGWFVAEEYDQDPNPLLRAQAAAAYGVTRGPRNLEQLERLLGDPERVVGVTAAAAVIRQIDR